MLYCEYNLWCSYLSQDLLSIYYQYRILSILDTKWIESLEIVAYYDTWLYKNIVLH